MSSWVGKARPPRWDFSGMEHSCWTCHGIFVGSNKFFLLEKGVFVKCNLCRSCWLSCGLLFIAAQLHLFNHKKANFQEIWRFVEQQKAALEGHFVS